MSNAVSFHFFIPCRFETCHTRNIPFRFFFHPASFCRLYSYLFSEHHRADVCPHLNKTAEGLQISSLRTLYLKASTLYSITPCDFIVSSLHTLYLKVSTLYSITPQGFIVLPPHASYREAFRPSNLNPFGLRGTSREIFPVVAHRHGSRKRTTRE